MPDSLQTVRDALAGRYAVMQPLGHGSMASVFLAEPVGGVTGGRQGAPPPSWPSRSAPERFLREIEIRARLGHPHIVPLLDSGEVGGFLYFVMPFVDGENAGARLQRDGAAPGRPVRSIALDVAEALDYAHGQGVVHRDIKPENILSRAARVVSDFGMARAIDAGGPGRSRADWSLGTPAYMSPEQAMARIDIGRPSDVYALGCVLYEMLTGELPFTGPTGQAVIAQHLAAPPRSMRAVRPELSRTWNGQCWARSRSSRSSGRAMPVILVRSLSDVK